MFQKTGMLVLSSRPFTVATSSTVFGVLLVSTLETVPVIFLVTGLPPSCVSVCPPEVQKKP